MLSFQPFTSIPFPPPLNLLTLLPFPILPSPDNDLPTPMVHLFRTSWLIKDCKTACTVTYSIRTLFLFSYTFTLSLSSCSLILSTSLLPLALSFSFFPLLLQNSYSAPVLSSKSPFTVKILSSLQCNHGA